MGKEYVEREATLKDLELLAKYQHGERQQGILAVCETIKRKPAADVVEVVRCKGCEYYENEECNNPRIFMSDGAHLYTDETDFCSYGERRAE